MSVAVNGNVGIGASAATGLTSGAFNTAVGFGAMTGTTTGSLSTAIGYQAMSSSQANTVVAIGFQAMQSSSPLCNGHVAIGPQTLQNDTTGGNVAVGYQVLQVDSTGGANTAVGYTALTVNTTGANNTALGYTALVANTAGNDNTALGNNAGVGITTGSNNIAIGSGAGGTLTTGSGNIYVNANAAAAGEATTTRIGTSQTRCFIAGIRGRTTGVADAIAVLIDSAGQLGTVSSSRKYKHDIVDMDDKSADILKLRPVTFAYNSDATEKIQYGLIAEEVDQIFPAIVVKNEDGQPETVQYHVLPVLLLNEVQKLHASVEQQQAVIENINDRLIALEQQN